MSETDVNKGFDEDNFTEINDDDEVTSSTPPSTAKEDDDYAQKSVYFAKTKMSPPITKQDVDEALKAFDEDYFTDIGSDDDEDVVREENVTYTLDIPEVKEEQEKVKTLFLGLKEWIVEVIREDVEISARTGSDKTATRQYNKEAEMPKITFAAPVKKMSFIKKFIIFLCVCAAVGIYFGIQANSYFWFKGGQEEVMACAWGWIMVEKLPIVTSPINTSAFMAGFGLGAGILGIIGLFIWLSNDEKKRSRVGHEHGNARLGTNRDFTMHKRRFMD